ncbi:unnamed protein product [Lymnaea stagnalis]|uniref:Methyltransferase type 11 domain-containing protein n=1 Tax=Lymnaea stagnalis TaxID=6523 RepID=A0AAV2HWI7_LYMST
MDTIVCNVTSLPNFSEVIYPNDKTMSNSSKSTVVPLAAEGFGSGGKNYDANRPGYSEETVDLIASTIKTLSSEISTHTLKYDVLELGAGTGKLTELLIKKLPQKIRYFATEPSENFLEVLTEKKLNVDVGVSAADDIPLPDASVGSVVCAQCFHWFAEEKDIASIRRVLVPGGRLILVWNVKDFSRDWMQAFYDQRLEVLKRVGESPKYWVNSEEWRRNIDICSSFKLSDQHSLPGINFGGGLEKVLSNLTTVSAYNMLGAEERDAYVDQLRKLLTEWPGLDLESMEIPFTTELYVYKAL